jgi:hypothetical protein
MTRQVWQGLLAVVVWALVLFYAGLPPILAILIPVDVVLFGLAVLRWRTLQTRHDG